MSPRGHSLRQGPRGVQNEWLAAYSQRLSSRGQSLRISFAKYPVSDPSQRLSSRGQSLRDLSPPGGSLQRTRLVPPKILVPRSWYQDLGTKILVPRSWYQDLVPRSWHGQAWHGTEIFGTARILRARHGNPPPPVGRNGRVFNKARNIGISGI